MSLRLTWHFSKWPISVDRKQGMGSVALVVGSTVRAEIQNCQLSGFCPQTCIIWLYGIFKILSLYLKIGNFHITVQIFWFVLRRPKPWPHAACVCTCGRGAGAERWLSLPAGHGPHLSHRHGLRSWTCQLRSYKFSARSLRD